MDFPKHPDPPKPPQKMTDVELQSSSDQMHQQERQHRELCHRVDSLADGQADLKRSIERLHCVDIAILIVGSIAAIAAVILLFLK